jgi:hypothetical protein
MSPLPQSFKSLEIVAMSSLPTVPYLAQAGARIWAEKYGGRNHFDDLE